MTCGGCSGAVERVLKKAEGAHCAAPDVAKIDCDWPGVSSYDVSLEKQEVLVTGTIPYNDLLEKIKKTGKEVCRPPRSLGMQITQRQLSPQVRSGVTLE